MRLGLLTLLFLAAAAPASAQDAGRAFTPDPQTAARFSAGPTVPHQLTGADGGTIHYDLTRPAGADVPARVPVVLVMTPYAGTDTVPGDGQRHAYMTAYFTARGYAVAIGHARGYGSSDGCPDLLSAGEIDATARVVEALGEAPWSSGRVGMIGGSYDAILAIAVAARGDRERTRYLKAIVPVAGGSSLYELSFLDGVPLIGSPTSSTAVYLAGPTLLPAAVQRPEAYRGRVDCAPATLPPSVAGELSGDHSPFFAQRDVRPFAGRIRAASLFVYGFKDLTVMPVASRQMFGRMSRRTPAAMVIGQWEHGFPDTVGLRPRADFQALVHAWFDQHLMRLDAGTKQWPRAQVQDQTGQWRAERTWPPKRGPRLELALSADGVLGAARPAGESAVDEAAGEAIFRTAPLKRELHLTGAMTLDLRLVLEQARTRVGVQLVALGADGQPVAGQPPVFGARSAQHLDPTVDGVFRQSEARDPALGVPVRVPVRIGPSDLRVPAGGSLQVKVSGSLRGVPTIDTTPHGTVPTTPSGSLQRVRILHDCAHLSVLRIRIADPQGELLNVREATETGALSSVPARRGLADGGVAGPDC